MFHLAYVLKSAYTPDFKEHNRKCAVVKIVKRGAFDWTGIKNSVHFSLKVFILFFYSFCLCFGTFLLLLFYFWFLLKFHLANAADRLQRTAKTHNRPPSFTVRPARYSRTPRPPAPLTPPPSLPLTHNLKWDFGLGATVCTHWLHCSFQLCHKFLFGRVLLCQVGRRSVKSGSCGGSYDYFYSCCSCCCHYHYAFTLFSLTWPTTLLLLLLLLFFIQANAQCTVCLYYFFACRVHGVASYSFSFSWLTVWQRHSRTATTTAMKTRPMPKRKLYGRC